MRVNWNNIKLVVLLLVAGCLYAFASHRNSERRVLELKVKFDDESRPFVTRETVNKLLIQNADSLTKSTKEKLALKDMEARVNTHPLIENAEVYVEMDGSLGVHVQQHKPIARLVAETSFYIGEEGDVLPLSPNFSARVPLVAGVSKTEVHEVHKLITFIKGDSFLEKHFVGVEKTKNGDFVLSPRTYRYRVVLGNVDKLLLKFSNYKAFYEKAKNDKTLKDYHQISLKYNNQVVCSKKQVHNK